MVENKITEYTRQDIVDLVTSGYYDKKNDKKIQYFWSGRLDEVSFLSRLYNLQQIESTDHRFKNAYGDITQHRINNWDWEDDWVFYDPRFGIKNLNDKEFLRFILEIFNPAVRDESKNWEEALEKINEFLKRDGFEIYESDNISGRQIFQYRRYSEMKIKLESQSNKHANLHLIGEGSYALVYYYKDDFYDKKIALKRAKKDLTSKELERFKREFDELKSFKSPYIIDVYSYNAENREYTMEYMDSNLYDFIRTNNDKLTTTERKNYVYQVLKAFKYIHSKGRLHRDINPKNILIKTTFRLPDENLFTLAITGNVGQEALIIVDEDVEQKTSNTQAVQRFINLSPDLPIADVFYNDKPVVDDIDYRDQTLYEYLDPGQYTVSVRGNLTGNDIVTSNIQFKPDRIYSIYIIGNPPNIELLQSVDGNTYACPQ